MLAPISLDTRAQPVRHRCTYDAYKKKLDPLAQTKATQARLAALGIIALGPWALGYVHTYSDPLV